ncbi:MAG: efflux RND transporter periplasmic adaptor subunit [Terriglobales bacterium]
MRHSRTVGRLLFALALLAALLLVACGGEKSSAGGMTSYSANDSKGDPTLFSLPPDQLSHLQIITVAPTTMQRVLRLPGSVAYNAFTTTPVISQVSGPVSRIAVVPGQVVNRGQPMLLVSSPDYAQLRSNYLKARDAHALAHKAYVRAKDLFEHHAIAQRDLEQAESTEVQAQADLEAAEQSLRIMGVRNPDAVVSGKNSPEVAVHAPITGQVVERLVAPGQLLQAGNTQCFTISNMSTVWVMVNVYQQDLAFVHVGDSAVIQTDAYGDNFKGKISYLGAALDPNTHTLQARIITQNPGEKLKKDMYVTALVSAGTIDNTLAVPDAAVLRTPENEPFVYIAQGDNKFAQRLVKLGQSQNGRLQIVSGLASGDRVVGDGSLFIQFQNSLQH